MKRVFIFVILFATSLSTMAIGKQQTPFLCKTVATGLGDPIIDNIDKVGEPVYLEEDKSKIIGYSKHCWVNPKIEYYYKSTKDNKFHLLSETTKYPKDLARTKSDAPYIVKVDRGTINRFLYTIAILEDPIQSIANKNYAWNKKLIYYFGGGVGIGFQQAGGNSIHYVKDFGNLLKEVDFLSKGYAVVFSTGTATSTHYNLQLGLLTAQLLKRHFIKIFGEPKFTIGFGSSGGAIQSYVYSEHDPELLDGAIAGYSYPDMITQIIHVGDCELLEHYFDVKAKTSWSWDRRKLIEGMYSSDNMAIKNASPAQEGNIVAKGCSTCVNGWRGTVPLVLNPHFNPIPGLQGHANTHGISHFEDLSNEWQLGIYPRNQQGVTPHIFDNEGVQYGLQALLNKEISKQDFLDINKNVGGWKPTELLVKEQGIPFGLQDKSQEFNPWSYQNSYHSTNGQPAKRSKISPELEKIVKNSGLYFSGKTNIPIIDWRPHLDFQGDMHFAYGSFMARARMERENKHHNNHIIWMTAMEKNTSPKTRTPKTSRQLEDALTAIDEWVTSYKNQEFGNGIAANKPINIQDGCFDQEGNVIHLGTNAWDGVINNKGKGRCVINPSFPIFSTSRIVAGDKLTGDTFKCNLVPVKVFMNQGGYKGSEILETDLNSLEEIFPSGVCG